MSKKIKVSTNCEIAQLSNSNLQTDEKKKQKISYLIKILLFALICTILIICYTYGINEWTKHAFQSKNTILINEELNGLDQQMKEVNEMDLSPFILFKKLIGIQIKTEILKKWSEKDFIEKEIKIKFGPTLTWVENELESLYSKPSYTKYSRTPYSIKQQPQQLEQYEAIKEK